VVSGVIDTADHKKIDFKVEYLREYEAICKKALTRGPRAQRELFDEKTRGRKSRGRVPLTIPALISFVLHILPAQTGTMWLFCK
jgi:hypothetical protein